MTDRFGVFNRSQIPPLREDDLDAVNSPTDGYVPSYDEASGKFEWVSNAGGVSTLADLTDVVFDSGTPADNQVLTYDAGTGKWKAEEAQGGLTELSEDTTPQLGGDLDIQTHKIVGNGGSDGIEITSAGIITNAMNSGARAYPSTAQINLTDATATQVVLGSETYDIQGEFASSTFTATVAGYYQVNAAVRWNNVITDSRYFMWVAKNGTPTIKTLEHSSIAQDVSTTISDVVYLAINDYLTLHVQPICGANTVDLTASADETFLSVNKIH